MNENTQTTNSRFSFIHTLYKLDQTEANLIKQKTWLRATKGIQLIKPKIIQSMMLDFFKGAYLIVVMQTFVPCVSNTKTE